MLKRNTPASELEKIYLDIDKYGYNSKYWSRIDEVIEWLESMEEYEKCADLYDYKKFYTDSPK